MRKNWLLPVLLFIAGSFLTTTVSAQQLNTLTAAQKQEGWKLLFNGHNLDGWHSYNESQPGKAWKVQGGTIVLDKNPGTPQKDYTDLTTDGEYSNFDLKLQWKLKPCTNSGIIFYVHESKQYAYPWNTGPEMQVVDLACSPDSKILMHRAGDLYDLVPSDTEWVTPGLQWNQVEIKADNGHVQLYLNGHKQVDTHFWDDHWKQLIANSKFAKMPNFGTFKKGHISLQGTEGGTKVWYRNIMIKELQ